MRRRDAEAFKAALEDDIRRGRYIDPDGGATPFSVVAESWLESKIDVRASTSLRYRCELRRYILPMWGSRTLREVTRDDLQRWVSALAAGDYPVALSGNRRSRPLAARSIRSIVGIVMAGILDRAVEDMMIRDNPARKVALPAIPDIDDDKVMLTIGEVERLATAAESIGGDLDGLLIRFQAGVGTRINEALALRIRDLDLGRGTARIRRTWTRALNGRKLLDIPKNGRVRTVCIPDFLIGPLRRQTEDRAPDDFVFRTSRGGAINDGNWRSRIWRKALEHAGMEGRGVTIHSLRHTYASIAIVNGADVKSVQKQLGHVSATVTLDTYAALWADRPDVADVVDRAWRRHARTPPLPDRRS